MVSADHYERLARLIEERRKKLGYARVGDFIAAVGQHRESGKVSDTALLNMRTGKKRSYRDEIKWAVCDALEWRRDSIDRVLAGGEPVVLRRPVERDDRSRPGDAGPAPLDSSGSEGLPQLTETVDRLLGGVEATRQMVDKLRADVDALQAGTRRGRRGAGSSAQ